MTARFRRGLSLGFLAIGIGLVVWGLITRSRGGGGVDGLVGDLQGQALVFSGVIMILIGVIDLVVLRLFRPLTRPGGHVVVAPGLPTVTAAGPAGMTTPGASATVAAAGARPADPPRLAIFGVDATATVTAARPTGPRPEADPVYALDLTVAVPGTVPYRVTHTTEVSPPHLALLTPGRTLPVRVEPTDPTQMLIQWEKVPVS